MKNLNEEIKRIKSLFGESRLYGNLVTEASGGRYGWLDDLIRMLDNTHPKGIATNRKWSKFSQRIKNADGFMGELRKSVDFQNFIKVDLQEEILTAIANVVTKNVDTAKLTDNLLADGVWNNIKKTLTDNGIDLSKSVSFKNQTQSVEKHLDDIWQMSTHKTSLDSLQNNIENLLSDKKVYSLDDASLDQAITKIRNNFDEELNLLKSSDESADVLDDVKNFVKKSADNTDVKTAEEIATAVQLAKNSIIKKGQIKGQQVMIDRKALAAEWADKYAQSLNDSFIGSLRKTPLTAESGVCKVMGWIRANADSNTGDQVFSLYFKDKLLPIKPLVDLLGFYPGRAFHRVLKYVSPKTIKSFNEMSTLYKISVLSGSVALQDGLAWYLLDLSRYVISKLNENNIFPNYYSGAINKQNRLIWVIDELSGECYEKKYKSDIFSVDANGAAYDDGEGLIWDDEEFNSMEIEVVDGLNKKQYQRMVKNNRKEKENESWLPDNFCVNFLCGKDGTPIKVECGRYGGIEGINTKQEAYDAAVSVGDFTQDVKELINENANFPNYQNLSDSSDVYKNKFKDLNIESTIDELIQNNDMEGLKLLFDKMGIDVNKAIEGQENINKLVEEDEFQ
jgi:hypothetical protein